MTNETLAEVIAHLEGVSVGSREADREIAYALGLGTEAERAIYGEHGAAGFTAKNADGFTALDRRQGAHMKWSRPGREGRRIPIAGGSRMFPVTGPQPLRDAPAYTTNLVAALSLVPEGRYWLAGYGRERPDEPLGGFQIFDPGDAEEPIASAEAATVELACCIAALRARFATETPA